MSAIITEQSTSVSHSPEMSQLKRKSLGGSPSPEEGHRDDAPNKRARVDDIVARDPAPDHPRGEDEIEENETGYEKDGAAPDKDPNLRDDNVSLDTRRPTETDTAFSSPRQERRPSKSTRRDSSSHTRSPDQDRRRDETWRRSRSPVRSPDQYRQFHREYTRRDSSPLRRERRDSGTSRRDPGPSRISKPAVVNREEEKKRGRRLFGGLLSTLSQTTTNSQQKRRQEIEKRQQEKAVKQKAEDDLRRNERLAKLDGIRKIEQVRFDEQVMRTRHSNMLAMAHGLQTKTEPKLYYRPWEPTKEQEDTIKDQIRDAGAQIQEELQQFKLDKAHRLRELGALAPSTPDAEAVAGEPAEETPSNNSAQDEFAATTTNDWKLPPAPAPVIEDKDQGEMVEAEEDTVIY